MTGKQVVRIGIIIGSVSDFIQCLLGLLLLQRMIAEGRVKIVFLRAGSIHRNTDEVLGWVRKAHEENSVDVLITGAGWANHLSGTVDAYLRHTLHNTTIQVFAVAFEDSKDVQHTQAAILSITEVPGHQMVFDNYIGMEGFMAACRDASSGEKLRELKVPDPRPTASFSLKDAIDLANPA